MQFANILSSITTLRTAFTCVITGITFYFLWGSFSNNFIENYEPAFQLAPLMLITIFCFSVSFSIVSLAEKAYSKAHGKIKSEIKKERDRKDFENRVEKILPCLNDYEINMLEKLCDGKQTIDIRDSDCRSFLKNFNEYKWIVLLHNPKPDIYVISLDITVRAIFLEFNKNRYEERVATLISGLDKPSTAFLSLFWQENLVYGTQESGSLMPRDVYNAGYLLSLDEMLILKCSRLYIKDGSKYIKFSLNEYPKKELQTSVFDAPPVHDEIELHLGYIQGTGSSGSGAPPRSASRLDQ